MDCGSRFNEGPSGGVFNSKICRSQRRRLLDLKKVAELYHCQFYKITNLEELRLSIQKSFQRKGIHIIEAQTNIDDNVKAHRDFMEKVKKVITRT